MDGDETPPAASSSRSLRVRRSNRSLRRALTKGRLDKAHALLTTLLAASDWHPLGRRVVDVAATLRGRLEANVRPEDGAAAFEPLVTSLKEELRHVADALPAYFSVANVDASLPWFPCVCDAVFNTGDTFLVLFDSYVAVHCRIDSRLLDIYQQMANLQMAHLGIPSSLWRLECTNAAVNLMRGLRVRVPCLSACAQDTPSHARWRSRRTFRATMCRPCWMCSRTRWRR